MNFMNFKKLECLSMIGDGFLLRVKLLLKACRLIN